jgi:hypothetical protein
LQPFADCGANASLAPGDKCNTRHETLSSIAGDWLAAPWQPAGIGYLRQINNGLAFSRHKNHAGVVIFRPVDSFSSFGRDFTARLPPRPRRFF